MKIFYILVPINFSINPLGNIVKLSTKIHIETKIAPSSVVNDLFLI